MPLPFVAWGVVALAAGVYAKKRGFKKGYQQAQEESQAAIHQYKEKLIRLQQERELVKDGFRTAMDGLAAIDWNDRSIWAKLVAFTKGYTVFHVYVVGIVASARARCLELGAPDAVVAELEPIVLGFIRGGFPDNLQKAVRGAWALADAQAARQSATDCLDKLPADKAAAFRLAQRDVEDAVNGLHRLHMAEADVQAALEELMH